MRRFVAMGRALLLMAIVASAAHADRPRRAGAPAPATPAAAQRPMGDMAPLQPAAADVLGEEPELASNFPTAPDIVRSTEQRIVGAIPGSAAPDVVGAFRFICMPGQLRFDDPILHPGKPGQSHLHQFFGNTGANAFSTYASLRNSGESTCMNRLNRSAYWMPAMLNGRGQVVRPNWVAIYYKRRPASDPECRRIARECLPLPRGLRFVFGFDMIHPDAPVTGAGYFNCQGPTAVPGHYPTIVEAAAHCPVGNQLGATINAPDCWDGKRLDSPDHRAHVGYISWWNGREHCPATHPYLIPGFTLSSWYTVDTTLDGSGKWDGTARGWHLSSDEMPGMTPGMTGAMRMPGSTFHADWFGAWDDATMRMWTANCIDRMLNCAGGELGNGRQLRQGPGFAWVATPHLVPIPPRPAGPASADASDHAQHRGDHAP